MPASGAGASDDPSCPWPCGAISTNIAELDRVIALEYGRVDDGQPADSWRPVGEEVGYLHDGPGGPELGFKVLGLSRLDVDSRRARRDLGRAALRRPGPGPDRVSAGEIIVAARGLLGEGPS
jgi:hypothetical protein